MRGKHANAAQRRRYLEGLERRATEAERAAESLKVEFADFRERSNQEIETLRATLREVKRQRDEGASPALEAANRRLQDAHHQLGLLKGDQQAWRDAASTMRRQIVELLKDRAGLSEPEINTLMAQVRRLGEETSEAHAVVASIAEFGAAGRARRPIGGA